MNKPHKHAEFIKAWADGIEVEFLFNGTWRLLPVSRFPSWDAEQYRIKPKLKDPGKVAYEAYYKAANVPNAHIPSWADPYWDACAKAVIDAYKAGELDI